MPAKTPGPTRGGVERSAARAWRNPRLHPRKVSARGAYQNRFSDFSDDDDVLDIDASTLASGMYQIRMSSNDYVLVKKLLVSE